MQVISTVQALAQERERWTKQVGFVPTMGYLHEGHLSLFKQARTENEIVIGSIFVNPAQFGPHEDLARYPRDLESDLHLLEAVGVDAVFVPAVAEMYPQGFTTYVVPEGPLAEQAEGAARPGHFRGVATVVLKLFQMVRPHRAYFGQKDAQQVAVIQRMVTDLNVPVQLRIVSTIREADGLAMSSRNSYLEPPMRNAASTLYRALQAGKACFEELAQTKVGSTEEVRQVERAMREVIAREPLIRLDYAEVRDVVSFLPLETLKPPALLLLAAYIGNTRLIDNFLVRADGTWDAGVIVEGVNDSRRERRERTNGRENNRTGHPCVQK
jgi:pantoate--beta-alanine ligase